MGAVDLVGFFMSIMRYNFKQSRWTVTVILSLFSIAVSNAHKIHNAAMGRMESLTEFVEALLCELETILAELEAEEERISRQERRKSLNRVKRKQYQRNPERLVKDKAVAHIPYFLESRQTIRCYSCGKGKPKSMCFTCNVPICLPRIDDPTTEDIKKSCWYDCHCNARMKNTKAEKDKQSEQEEDSDEE
tara:strand:- start:1132 stop:1701 length:570 start_codon:yes stop_codon:yes gene_type:complete